MSKARSVLSRRTLALLRCQLLAVVAGMLGNSAWVPTVPSSLAAHLIDPKARDARYGSPLNVAQYLVDLHDSRAVFNFCGCLMFQLSLSPRLKEHLARVAQDVSCAKQQPKIFDASFDRLFKIEGYAKSPDADNMCIFHGREVRQVPTAAGGQECVLQLSLANEADPEGWTEREIGDYNGWAHDSQRPWRRGDQLEREGFEDFQAKFGEAAYALHHRFYLHLDGKGAMWLSAEDGCEGEPWPQ
eukprot:CAMPEP_0179103918 /NCGR_PEP_ID=MMETSP0796-20121207/48178_1 /TAXON_ID=73915 /ORGANISM="Pyrodinium bahamense, Strain pbaha01" /LENGTH=242 /DNA_ID=CAMNT_0020801845 /DNA_START=1 /DNA_END=729 /DNA_ORIENTATION=+